MSDFPTRRALDELADIYLTGPAEPVRVEPGAGAMRSSAAAPALRLSGGVATSRPPAIEALLLGHLPGYASPWVSQYAHFAGAAYGGAVLVRVHEQVELELFSDASEPPQGGELTQTMEALCPLAERWLVLIDNPSSPGASQRLMELPRWTLLSGADDAAVVAGFRMLKSLIHDCGGKQPPGGIGVMFMGCEEAVAADAARRLNRAAEGLLERPIELLGARQRMQPVRRRYIGHYETPPGRDTWAEVGAFLCELNELGSAEDGDAGAATALPGDETLQEMFDEHSPFFSAVKIDDTAPPTAAGLQPRQPMPRATISRPLAPVAVDIAEVLPPPEPAQAEEKGSPAVAEDVPEPVPAAAAAAATLAGHAGLTAIEPRCPRQSAVELALDAAGRLHLLLRHAAGQTVDASLRQLMQARAWAAEHMDLLTLACRPAAVAADAAPALHLFTTDVAAALPLADLGVHIHLLRSIATPTGEIQVHERLT